MRVIEQDKSILACYNLFLFFFFFLHFSFHSNIKMRYLNIYSCNKEVVYVCIYA